MPAQVGKESSQVMAARAGVEHVIAQLDTAATDMLKGDSTLWKELMSHCDDVTLYGAHGGYVTGWEEVSARFDRTATGYGQGGGRTSHEIVAMWIDTGVAVVIGLERHEWRQEGKAEMTSFTYRVTHVLRREAESRKIVLRHADPLATFRGPEFAHRS